MPAGVRNALPQILTTVESFADVTITDADEPPVVLQVISRIWVYEDHSWMMAVHNVENPAINHVEAGNDPVQAESLLHRASFLRRLAAGQASCLPATG